MRYRIGEQMCLEFHKQGIGTEKVAKLLGVSRQAVYWMFHQDRGLTVERVERVSEILNRNFLAELAEEYERRRRL